MQKTIEKICPVSEIIAFEFVALNTHIYQERILVIGSQYVNSLKISDTTKAELFELKFFQSDQNIWQSYCRVDFSSVSGILTCWLSIRVLTPSFLAV